MCSNSCVSILDFQDEWVFSPTYLPKEHVFRFCGRSSSSFSEHWLDVKASARQQCHHHDGGIQSVAGGARLHALFFAKITRDEGSNAHNSQHKVVLFFHGNAHCVQQWGNYAMLFNNKGFDVLMPDYRHFGKSTGPMSEDALNQDALRWYDYLTHELGYESSNITIHGVSIGTTFGMFVASRKPCRKLVLETPFDCLYTLAQHHIGRIVSFLCWILFKYQFNNYRYVENITCPIFMMHSTDDQVIPIRSFESLCAELAKHNRDYHSVVTHGAGHSLQSSPMYSDFIQMCYD